MHVFVLHVTHIYRTSWRPATSASRSQMTQNRWNPTKSDDDNGEAAEEDISVIKTKAKQLKKQWGRNLEDTISRLKASEGNEYLIINFRV